MSRRDGPDVLVNPSLDDVGDGVFVNHPTGLLKIGAHLRTLGRDVVLLDACPAPDGNWITSRAPAVGDPIDDRWCGGPRSGGLRKHRFRVGRPDAWLEERLRRLRRPRHFWIGSSMTFHWEGVHRAVTACRHLHPGVPVTVGGIYATLCPDHARASGADDVHVGEFPAAGDLPPAYELLEPPPPGYAIVKTTRGCPRRCTYCAVHSLEGRVLRHRPLEDVTAEIRARRRDGMREIIFWESNITCDAEDYLDPLLDRVAALRPRGEICFPEGFDPRHLTAERCRRLWRAGVRRVVLSLESVDPGLRRSWGKAGPIEAYVAATAYLREAGFALDQHIRPTGAGVFTFVLAGLPGQSLASILRSLVLVWRCGSVPQIMRFTPIPGTVEYQRSARRYARRGLEGLAPGLWPGAWAGATAADLEETYRRCHGHFVPLERLRELAGSSRVLRGLRAAAAETFPGGG